MKIVYLNAINEINVLLFIKSENSFFLIDERIFFFN